MVLPFLVVAHAVRHSMACVIRVWAGAARPYIGKWGYSLMRLEVARYSVRCWIKLSVLSTAVS